jgi:hypothetical protein
MQSIPTAPATIPPATLPTRIPFYGNLARLERDCPSNCLAAKPVNT